MDFTLIEKRDNGNIYYKLLKATFYKGYFAIIAQNKKEFFCSSFACENVQLAKNFFYEICESNTEIYTLHDIISDYEKHLLLSEKN